MAFRLSSATRQKTRWCLVALAVAVAGITATMAVVGRPERTSVAAWKLNNGLQAAIDLQLTSAESLYQVALVFVAALWGLVIAKKDEAAITLGDRPEIALFVTASVLLLTSVLMYHVYIAQITEALRIAGVTALGADAEIDIPDVFDSYYAHLFWYQRRFLIAGAVCGVLTLLSAHHLRES